MSTLVQFEIRSAADVKALVRECKDLAGAGLIGSARRKVVLIELPTLAATPEVRTALAEWREEYKYYFEIEIVPMGILTTAANLANSLSNAAVLIEEEEGNLFAWKRKRLRNLADNLLGSSHRLPPALKRNVDLVANKMKKAGAPASTTGRRAMLDIARDLRNVLDTRIVFPSAAGTGAGA